MAIGDFEFHERAGRLLRAVPEPGWQAIEPAVLSAVRATPRGGWPLKVEDPQPGSTAGVIYVSDLVLTAEISRALTGGGDYIVDRIDVISDGDVLQGISVQLSGRYQADLNVIAAQVRNSTEAVVAEVIGNHADVDITVTVTDVHR